MGGNDMMDKEILDMQIKNLKNINCIYVAAAVFILHPVPFILLMTIYSLWGFDGFYADSPNPIESCVLLLLFNFLLLFFGIWFVKYARLYKRLIKMLETIDPSESETRTLTCEKYRFIVRGTKHHTYKTGVIVITDSARYYYIFARESLHLSSIPLGEHEVELYKGTNIIKKFDAADDAQSKFSIWD